MYTHTHTRNWTIFAVSRSLVSADPGWAFQVWGRGHITSLLTTFLWLLFTPIQRQNPYEVGKALCALLPISFLTSAPSACWAVYSWAFALLAPFVRDSTATPWHPHGSPCTHFQSLLKYYFLERPPYPFSQPCLSPCLCFVFLVFRPHFPCDVSPACSPLSISCLDLFLVCFQCCIPGT